LEEKPTSFPANIDIHNYDISTLFIETRGWMCKLFSDMSQKSGTVVKTYKTAIYYFIQLFEASRYMVRKSGKIEDWNKKEFIYLKFLYNIQNNHYLPKQLIDMWRALSDDIVTAGIYDEDEMSEIKTVVSLMGRGE